MGIRSRYRFLRQGGWKLLVCSESWSQGLWAEILSRLEKQDRTDHPKTLRLCYPAGENGEDFYLKIYHRSDPLGMLKGLFRASKARRALIQEEALSREGFNTPLVIAAGEKRKVRFLNKAFLLTRSVEGSWLPLFLKAHFSHPLDPASLRRKREYLRQLALEIRRLHQCGFIHGDLTPYNILVQAHGERIVFFYVDNDRTLRYPCWTYFPRVLSKRNLVQLNRFVLPGISLQDRVRFLRHYLGKGTRGRKERRLIHWLEQSTRRRHRKKGVREDQLSFRELMRWKGTLKVASNKNK